VVVGMSLFRPKGIGGHRTKSNVCYCKGRDMSEQLLTQLAGNRIGFRHRQGVVDLNCDLSM
jgi:hypothetical protein